MIRKLLTISLLLLTAISTAKAESFDLDDPVAGHPDKTWADIVRLIVPDLDENGQGSTVIDLPYLVDLGDGEPPPQPELPVSIHSIDVEPVRTEGRTLTAMLVDLGSADGWAVNVVALALLDEDLKRLDVINIGQDKLNGLRPPLLQISDKDDALLVYSEHFNSNQVYGSYALIMVRDGKFQTIDTYATLNDSWCGHDRKQTLTFNIPPAGKSYWPITATITDLQAEPDPAEDCGDEVLQPGFENAYSVTYNWSASMGIYVADGEGLNPIYEMNQSRY